MAIYKTISSKSIIRKVMRDLKPNTAHWVDDAVEWIGEALEHIGAAPQLMQKQCVLSVKVARSLVWRSVWWVEWHFDRFFATT